MPAIASIFNNSFTIPKTAYAASPVKSNAPAFTGGNYELEGPQKDTFELSTPALSARKSIKQLSEEEKNILADTLAQAGCSAFEAGKYQSCINNLDKSLELNPDNAGAYHAKASAQKELGLFEQAIENYAKAALLRPDSANTLRLSALTKEKYAKELERSDKQAANSMRLSAAADYSKFISIMQADNSLDSQLKTADAYSRRAKILADTKSYETAIGDFNSAIEIYSKQLEQEPRNVKLMKKIGEAYHIKGRCYQHLSKNPGSREAQEAIASYSSALNYIPNSANTYFRRAQLNIKQNTEAAIDDLKSAIDLAPERCQYWQTLGEIMTMSDDAAQRELGFEFLAKAIQLKMKK